VSSVTKTAEVGEWKPLPSVVLVTVVATVSVILVVVVYVATPARQQGH